MKIYFLQYRSLSLSGKELLASGILNHAFGANSGRVKYSTGSSKLAKSVASLASEPFAVSSFNANYSDTGLFGFHIIADKGDVGKVRFHFYLLLLLLLSKLRTKIILYFILKVVKGVYNEIQKSAKNGLTNDEITRAK